MTKRPAAKSVGEETLALHLKAKGIMFTREWRFHPTRKWRFDFIVNNKLAIEVDGGNRMVRNGAAVGSHTKAQDYMKLNEAVILGWRVLRFTPAQVKSGYAIDAIRRAMA